MMLDSILWLLSAVSGVAGMAAWYFFPGSLPLRGLPILSAFTAMLHGSAAYLYGACPLLVLFFVLALRPPTAGSTRSGTQVVRAWPNAALAGVVLLAWMFLALPAAGETFRFRSVDARAPTATWAEVLHDFSHHPEAVATAVFLCALIVLSLVRLCHDPSRKDANA